MPLVSSLSLPCGSSVLITVSGDQFRSRLEIGIINWIPIDLLEVCSRYVSCIYSWYLSTHMMPALPLEYNGNLTPITIHYIALCIRYIFESVLVDRNTFQFSNGKVNFLRWGLLVKTFIDYKFYILFQWIEKSAEKVEYNVRRLGGVRTGLLRRLSLTSYYFVYTEGFQTGKCLMNTKYPKPHDNKIEKDYHWREIPATLVFVEWYPTREWNIKIFLSTL